MYDVIVRRNNYTRTMYVVQLCTLYEVHYTRVFYLCIVSMSYNLRITMYVVHCIVFTALYTMYVVQSTFTCCVCKLYLYIPRGSDVNV